MTRTPIGYGYIFSKTSQLAILFLSSQRDLLDWHNLDFSIPYPHQNMDRIHYSSRNYSLAQMPFGYGWSTGISLEISYAEMLSAFENRPDNTINIEVSIWDRWRSYSWEKKASIPRDYITHWKWLNAQNGVIGYSSIEITNGQINFHIMAIDINTGHMMRDTLVKWYLDNNLEPAKKAEAPEDMVPVCFWHNSKNGPRRIEKNIKCPKLEEIKENYPEKVYEGLHWTATHPDPLTVGKLVFWMGVPGTGKTWSVRALMREWQKRAMFHVITDPEVFFNDSDYLRVVIENTQAGRLNLIVIEDSPRVVLQEARGTYETHAMSRLLNLTDGLWGEASQSIFLLTTNDDIKDIDPAFLRDGRLLQRLSFRGFNEEEATEWLRNRGDEKDHDSFVETVQKENADEFPLCKLYGILRNAAGSRIRTEEAGPMGFKTTAIFENKKPQPCPVDK